MSGFSSSHFSQLVGLADQNFGLNTLSGLSADQISNISTEALEGFSLDIIESLSSSALSGFSAEQIASLPEPNSMLTVINNLPSDNIEEFTSENIAAFHPTAMLGFSDSHWENLPTDAMQGMTAAHFQALEGTIFDILKSIWRLLRLGVCQDYLDFRLIIFRIFR